MGSKIKSRKETIREYRERVKQSGVYQVKNTEFRRTVNRHKFMLKIESRTSKYLQKEQDELNPDKFIFEISEKVRDFLTRSLT